MNDFRTRVYRFVSGDVGIYEAVENDCPRRDIRRNNKPDGSWLPRVGGGFPGAISFWTEFGLKKYRESGLLGWHASVLKTPASILVAEMPTKSLYVDEFQVICMPSFVTIVTKLEFNQFEESYGAFIPPKVAASFDASEDQ